MLSIFNGFSLRTKGYIIACIAAVALVSTALIARNAITQLNAKLTNTAQVIVPQLAEISQTFSILQAAQLEVVRTSSLANAGLSGDPMQRQFEKARTALTQVASAYEFASAAQEGSITEVTSEMVTEYIAASWSALEMLEIEPVSGTIMINTADRIFADIMTVAQEVSANSITTAASEATAAISASSRSSLIFAVTSLASFLACIAATLGVIRSITKPINNLTANMKSLSDGKLDIEIDGGDLDNEIGQMVKALKVFQDTAIARKALMQEQEAARIKQAEAEKAVQEAKVAEAEATAARDLKDREEAEARAAQYSKLEVSLSVIIDQARMGVFSARIEEIFDDPGMEEIKEGVNELLRNVEDGLSTTSDVLQTLASGKLYSRFEGDQKGMFALLQEATNSTAEQFQNAIQRISENAEDVRTNSQEIAASATNLAQRTESTAANLEETSSAIEQLTASVRSSADGAQQVNQTVARTLENTHAGAAMVQEAVVAMNQIADVAQKIASIVSVINDISFQTNLLALNAGVEAARAGESGRGFSVVASEVRALAQRASEAAKQIEDLISESGQRVEAGVTLVNKAGNALQKMSVEVAEVASGVEGIANGAREQASGISEINAAITQIDETTQQNAAMFEETTAASVSLAEASQTLASLAGDFDTGPKQKTAEVRQPRKTAKRAVGSNTMPQMGDVTEGEWRDF